MIPSWNRRTWVHGDLADINPFGHRQPAPVRSVVEAGVVVDAERFAAILPTLEVTELTPPSRLPAIHKIEYAKPVKPQKAFETADIIDIVEVLETPDSVESYTRIEEIVRKESRSTDDFEEAQDLPWREAA